MKWVLLAFLSVAAASQVKTWSAEKEYKYHYTTSVLSGIPELGKQYAGLKLSTIIKAQKTPNNNLRIKFEESKFRTYNEEVMREDKFPGAPRRDEEEHEVPSSVKRYLEMGFKVVINTEGLVEKIQCEVSEPEYITNMKKAAVSQLLALSQSKLTHEDRSNGQQEEFVASLKKPEVTVVGECETQYTIARMPEYLAREFEERELIPRRELCDNKEYYEVVKSKDLKNCKERPIYLHMWGANSVSDGSLGSTAPFVDEASVIKSVICGSPNDFIVRKASNEHKYIISPSGKFDTKEKMEVTSMSVLSFHSIEDKSEEIADVRSPKPNGSLMFEYPKDDSFSARASEKSMLPEPRNIPEGSEEEWYKPQIAQPDIVSRPKTLFPTIMSPVDTIRMLALNFERIVEIAKQSPESAYSGDDVAGSVVLFSRAMVKLGLEDIKSLWSEIEAKLPDYQRETAYHTFLDLVSICGTNPAVKYIIEEVKSAKLREENAAMIMSNAIRSVKTPTKELLKELIDLLKQIAEQDNRKMISTVALSVTHLIHKACIHKTSSVYDFPVKSFGKFCDEKSPEITRDLIPFLAEKLFAASKTDTNKLLTYINALGNLGHDGAALHLLKLVDDASFSSHARFEAVTQLIKSAPTNPALYRPVILQLIANEAEAEEVRMAAVTALPYTRPSSFHFNKVAIRTWWEASKQVASYITSTLRTLADIPRHSPIYDTIAEPAQVALRLAKPEGLGIQTSNSLMVTQFLDTLKAAVTVKVQRLATEDSSLPTDVFIKKSMRTKSHTTDCLETRLHWQGIETLVNKMYDVSSSFLPQEEREQVDIQRNYIKSIINGAPRRQRRPEAHATIKAFGLQGIFSIDDQMVEQLIERVARESAEAMIMEKTHAYDFLKIIDINGHTAVIPTESGLPVHINHQTPLVVSGKASIDIKMQGIKNGEVEMTIKPVANFKQISHAGIFCPITKKFLGAGVDTNLHLALPLSTEVTLKDGQISVVVKTPEDQESQKEKPVMELRVKPFTTNYDITSTSLVSVSKSSNSKIIKSHNAHKVREVPVGHALGLDLKLRVESEQPFIDMAEMLHQLMDHRPLTLITLELPLKTVKDHSAKLIFNPRNSNTKEVSFVVSMGHGIKLTSGQPEFTTYSNIEIPSNIEQRCRERAQAWRQNEKKDQQKKEQRMEKCLRRASQSKCEEEATERLGEETEEKKYECEREEKSLEEKKMCLREHSRHSRPSSEVEMFCTKYSAIYKQKCFAVTSIRKCIKSTLQKIPNDSRAVSVNMQASLHGQDFAILKKIDVDLTVGVNKPRSENEDKQVKVILAVKAPQAEKPYIMDVDVISKVKYPVNKWDKDAIINEDITSVIKVQTKVGFKYEKVSETDVDVSVERSEELKRHARESEAWRNCDNDLSKGVRLSVSCKKARTMAASLDVIKVDLALPKDVSRNPYLDTVVAAVKVYFLPYLAIEESRFNEQSAEQDHFRIVTKVAPNGKSFTVDVSDKDKKTVFKNVRLHSIMKYVLPITIKDSLPVRLIHFASNNKAPSSCSVEGNRVSSFDKVIYDYTLNNCEHVIFKDYSESPKMMVTVKKTSGHHIVKVVVDGNKYELEMVKSSRGYRGNPGQVKVNGQVKRPESKQPGKPIRYEDAYNVISLYEDGVYEIFSPKYGLWVRADSQATEVKTYQQALRNMAGGLCGDLNDEKTADVKSSQECIMSMPKLAAYSYMVVDNQCEGIPSQDKTLYQEEVSKCVKKELIPTKVYNVFVNRQHIIKRSQSPLKHVIMEEGQRICISKRQIKVCSSNRSPSELVPEQLPFFCMARDQKARDLKAVAESGERIEEAERYPISFTSTLHVPRRC